MSFLLGRSSPNTVTKWDHTFEWTADHMSAEQTAPLKQTWDQLADAALERLDALSPPPKPASTLKKDLASLSTPASALNQESLPASQPFPPSSSPATKPPRPRRDLVALLRQHRHSDPVLAQLWAEATTVPAWVDWAQVARGQDVFYRYGGASVNGLAFQSLVGGMGAARVVEVLARTGGFGTHVARHRIYETTQWVLQCTRDVQSIMPPGNGEEDDDHDGQGDGEDEESGEAGEYEAEGLMVKEESEKKGAGASGLRRRRRARHDGWEASVRVRLLHAAVRRRILALEQSKPGYYDVPTFGVPINDLDCAGTIASFSASLIWLSFPRQGIRLRSHEIADYLALWRYLGYLLGLPEQHCTSFFGTPTRAKALMESLLVHEVAPSALSGALARNVIEALASIPPTYASREFLSATCRWLLGDALCDELTILRPPAYYRALVAGQCLFFMAMNYSYRSVARWDARKNALMRRGMWRWIVESEHGLAGGVSDFEFKYTPEVGKTTVFESLARTDLVAKGVERRNLIVFGVFSGVMAISAVVSYKIVATLVRMVAF